MSPLKILYVKPKSSIRELVQKLFLKILSKLFPKNFLYYKNKIKIIMNKGGFYLSFILAIVYLRFKYPLYFNIPSKQIYALDTLIKFSEVLKKQEIDFFVLGGTLLGGVRQESFAGRPSDIDLGIKEDQVSKLLDAIPLLIKNGARIIKRGDNDKFDQFQIECRCTFVDIAIYRKKKVGENEIWIGENEDPITKFIGTTFPIEDLEHLIPIKIYGKQFMAPANPEKYLEKRYGKNWKIPDKKQFFWNKKSI